MSEGRNIGPPMLSYAEAHGTRRFLVVWMTPLWCGLIIIGGVARILPGWHDDPFWFAAMALAIFNLGVSVGRRDKIGMLICFATFAALLGVGMALPYFNRAAD